MATGAARRPPPLPPPVERALEASRREGVLAQLAAGTLDYYLVPFCLQLGATSGQIGLIAALPSLVAAATQFFVVDVLRWAGNRRRLLLWCTALQAALLAPLAPLALARRGGVAAVTALVVAFRGVGAVMGPPWGSLMSELLPERRRGDYFGRRSQAVGLAGLAGAAVGGGLLWGLHGVSPGRAFCGLFALAAAARAASFRYMRRMPGGPEPEHRREPLDWSEVRSRLRRSNVARFVAYVAAVTFAAQLSSAYMSVHMLRDLRFDYARYTAVQLASAAAGFLAFPLWGRDADLVGNARVLRFNSFLLPLIPVLWTMTETAWGLALIEAGSGFLWAGFNLCATNFLYDAVPPHKRVRVLGWFNLLNGAALFLGAALGGVLADRLPRVGGYSLHALFLAAAAARLAADLFLADSFAEVRDGAPKVTDGRLFFSVLGLRPLVGPNQELEWEPPASLTRR